MRRWLLFGILGPLLCVLLVFAWPTAEGVKRLHEEETPMILASIFGGWGVALLPMLPLAGLDRLLARWRWRAPAVGLAGFGLGAALWWGLITESASPDAWRYWYMLGAVIGLPALVCSWLVAREG